METNPPENVERIQKTPDLHPAPAIMSILNRLENHCDERYMATMEETQKTMDAFFISTEPLVLKSFSSKEKKKLIILRVISEQFKLGRHYSEKEINQVLQGIYEDMLPFGAI